MAKIILGTHLDLDGNQLQNSILHPLSEHPTTIGEGQFYYNSTEKTPYINIGGDSWLDLSFNVLNSNTNKIDEQYLPESLLGKVEYVGGWDADTNTPDIGLASESKGKYYIITTPGVFEGIEFKNKDWVISNGTTWEKVDNTESVISIFGRQGSVVAQEGDYAAFYPKKIDVFGKTEINNFFSGVTPISGYNNLNWNTAYGWGNHADVGYLTNETDPTVPQHVKDITTTDINSWSNPEAPNTNVRTIEINLNDLVTYDEEGVRD